MLAVNRYYVSYPPVRLGLAVHAAVLLLLLAAAAFGLRQFGRASDDPLSLLYLMPALLAVAMAPALAYRAYALWRAVYVLERDGLRLGWGLRQVDIPMDAVLWVREDRELPAALPLPWFRLPGAVLGVRKMREGQEVEYLAASGKGLVFVATPGRIYGLTPEDRSKFLAAYRRYAEFGSLTPLPARSVYPSFLLARVWAEKPARRLLLVSILSSLLLLIWTVLGASTHPQVFLGFNPDGSPRDLTSGVRLLLLPWVSAALVLLDFFLGLFFFRHKDRRLLAYLLWAGMALTPMLFLVGVFWILRLA